MRKTMKKARHEFIAEAVRKNPFLKDEDLARACKVSVSTIRFDRAELGIAEYRERVKNAAEDGMHNNTTDGELLDINLLHSGISILETYSSMLFENTDIVRGQCIYALAENLALHVIGARAALVKVANVKYTHEVHAGERLVARSEVIRVREKEFIVHVFIKANMHEVFRGKFSLSVPENESEEGNKH